MISDSGTADEATPSHADFLAFLDQIESDNPDVAASVIDREVDSLLGRVAPPPKVSAAQLAKWLDDAPRQSAAASAFTWYQPLVRALPPIMSAERTVDAARAIEAGLLADEQLATIDRAAVTRTHLRDLRALVDEGRREYETLLAANLRLVFHWCKGIASSMGSEWVQDAFQAGAVGLIRGIQGWDYRLGYALSTYVSWHIRQQIQRWRLNETSMIRIPAHVIERLESAPEKLSRELVRAASRAQRVLVLEIDVDLDDPSLLWDGGLDDVVDDADSSRLLARALGELTEREASVVMLRYGLSSLAYKPLTLEEIGQMFEVSRERIRQIESIAMKKIREMVASDLLAESAV